MSTLLSVLVTALVVLVIAVRIVKQYELGMLFRTAGARIHIPTTNGTPVSAVTR
jgi:hypothetical protein